MGGVCDGAAAGAGFPTGTIPPLPRPPPLPPLSPPPLGPVGAAAGEVGLCGAAAPVFVAGLPLVLEPPEEFPPIVESRLKSVAPGPRPEFPRSRVTGVPGLEPPLPGSEAVDPSRSNFAARFSRRDGRSRSFAGLGGSGACCGVEAGAAAAEAAKEDGVPGVVVVGVAGSDSAAVETAAAAPAAALPRARR